MIGITQYKERNYDATEKGIIVGAKALDRSKGQGWWDPVHKEVVSR